MINSKNFDNIRVIAILMILFLHTFLNNFILDKYGSTPINNIQSYDYLQIFCSATYLNLYKAGTILFFIISGFLFQMQCHKFSDFSFFIRKKAHSLLWPYLIFFVLPILFLYTCVMPYIGYHEQNSFYSVFMILVHEILFSNYWFVPALFVTLVLNFFVKSKNLIFYLSLFILIWLIAVINIYVKFVDTTTHTMWFIGFFFVFAIGRLIFLHNEKLSKLNFLKNKSILIIFCFVFYVLSNMESMAIFAYSKNLDFANTLRFTNICYSFGLFFLFNAILDDKNWSFLKKYNIYFIYLIHPFVLRVTGFLLVRSGHTVFGFPVQFVYNLLHFLIVLFFCLFIHKLFFSLRWNNRYLYSYFFKEKLIYHKD
jgi:hypothetical protein